MLFIGLKEAYNTGRGKIKMRARAHIETAKSGKESIVITEVPYQTNKSNLVEKIVSVPARDKRIPKLTNCYFPVSYADIIGNDYFSELNAQGE